MSNRAARRQKVRGYNQRVSAPKSTPSGEHGVYVDSDGDWVVLTFAAGEVNVSVKWDKRDAHNIARMIDDASDRAGTPAEGIIEERGSGIVVARTIPTT